MWLLLRLNGQRPYDCMTQSHKKKQKNKKKNSVNSQFLKYFCCLFASSETYLDAYMQDLFLFVFGLVGFPASGAGLSLKLLPVYGLHSPNCLDYLVWPPWRGEA